jgi:hypothetical protein
MSSSISVRASRINGAAAWMTAREDRVSQNYDEGKGMFKWMAIAGFLGLLAAAVLHSKGG